MKKIKKILAMMLAMAMVLGMSMTTFAAPSDPITITVKNAEEAELSYVHAIKPDQTKDTGWAFVNDDIADAYTKAFGVTDPQVAIIMLAKYQDSNAYKDLTIATGVDAATAGQIDIALSNVANSSKITFSKMDNPMEVTEAGIYIIKATEEGYTYKNMAAYVGFGESEDGIYPVLESAELTAKKASTVIDKENLGEAADNAVAVGDTVEFEVKTNFPYVDANTLNKRYVITDKISGAEFVPGSATLTVGDESYAINPEILILEDGTIDDSTWVFDLSAMITDNNEHAGKEVVLKYSAIVTEVTATNEVDHETDKILGHDETKLYTGSITITKYGEDEGTTLEGAEFVVARVNNAFGDNEAPDDNMGVGIEYATFDDAMKLTGWVTDVEKATHVVTGENGTATVNGLDEGQYLFAEVKAPKGYSINDDPAIANLEIGAKDEKGAATAVFSTATNMKDTKLSSLPSTGGIGTTIFTIGGCAIMILAAALYFMTRRKSAK